MGHIKFKWGMQETTLEYGLNRFYYQLFALMFLFNVISLSPPMHAQNPQIPKSTKIRKLPQKPKANALFFSSQIPIFFFFHYNPESKTGFEPKRVGWYFVVQFFFFIDQWRLTTTARLSATMWLEPEEEDYSGAKMMGVVNATTMTEQRVGLSVLAVVWAFSGVWVSFYLLCGLDLVEVLGGGEGKCLSF